MKTQWMRPALLLGCALAAATALHAQEVVHALTGTMTSVDAKAKTFQVATDDGTEGQFSSVVNPKLSYEIPSKLKGSVTPAANFNKVNTRVLVYYIGDNSVRTAVAVEDLGAGPFVKVRGTVVKLDKHKHSLTVADDAGKQETFQIGPKTVAEAADGVEEGMHFDAQKGDAVRVTASTANGAEDALFIRSM